MSDFADLLRHNRNYRYTWLGQIVSETGDYFNNIAVFSLVMEVSGSGLVVSGVMLSRAIPAVLAVTHNPFVAYTSNVAAILGLRSLYFALASMLDRCIRTSMPSTGAPPRRRSSSRPATSWRTSRRSTSPTSRSRSRRPRWR